MKTRNGLRVRAPAERGKQQPKPPPLRPLASRRSLRARKRDRAQAAAKTRTVLPASVGNRGFHAWFSPDQHRANACRVAVALFAALYFFILPD